MGTSNVKNMDEVFLYAERPAVNTIVAARAVGQRITMKTATTFASVSSAVRGAGHVGASVAAYAVALTAIDDATDITIGGGQAVFPANSPPGTAVLFDANIDIQAAPTILLGVVGNRFAIVQQPPARTNLMGFTTAKSGEPLPLTRDVRDRGVLSHRKGMAQEGGVLNITEKFQNFAAGLAGYVGQNMIVIVEREDNRDGIVTEREVYYGANIEIPPALNETEGDTDTDYSPVINYEMRAVEQVV